MELSELKRLLDYNPATGNFHWKVSRGCRKPGDKLNPRSDGYVCVKLYGIHYKAHNLAWWIVTGEYPKDLVDHKNCNQSDNRFDNLRQATRKGNSDNASLRSDNKSGVKGVSWKASHGRWCAQCSHNGKVHHLGLFDDLEKAKEVVMKFREQMHGEFANHGI